MIVNYACKSKEIWQRPCPLFVRSIAMEGSIGPVAGSSHHSLYHRMPGVKIASPMTPNEYKEVYEHFMTHDDVVYVSEHRGSYDNTEEFVDSNNENPDIVLFPISVTRFEAEKARKSLTSMGFNVNIYHQLWLKPHLLKPEWITAVNNSKYGAIVLDDDYEDGISKSIAHKIMMNTNKKVYVMGLDPRTAGFHREVDNLPPSVDKIVAKVLKIAGE